MSLAPSSSTLSVRLFGPTEFRVNASLIQGVHGRVGLWVLALLVLRHPAPVGRQWMAGVLWPDSEHEQASANLRKRLYELRRALGAEGRRLYAPNSRTIGPDLEGAEVDVLAFDAALKRGEPSDIELAVELYRGPLLEGCSEEWCLPERAAREQAYLKAQEDAAAIAMRANEPASAVRCLRHVIAVDPLRESAQGGLLQALAAAGDYAAAVQAYREFRLLLRQELNADPAAETIALYNQIRQQARAVPESRVHTGALVSPGRAPSHNLPAPVTSFVGRAAEKQQIQQLLAASRLLTLTGAGGVGKTRLAIEVGADLLTGYADGVWLVELAALTDPGLVDHTAAESLGVPEAPGEPIIKTLLSRLKAKQILLILDNCEHLLDASARLAEAILRDCANVKVLASSREPLRIYGESLYRVPSLSLPEADKTHTPAGLGRYEAAQLFIDRAVAARADFAVTVKNSGALASLCNQLDGIPFAIELAAALVRYLPVEEINGGLDKRFRLLTGGSRTALPRHKTLKAMIDWSYDLLDEKQQSLLCSLSVFSGGWRLEAAKGVCGDEVLVLLLSLVDKSLVVIEERPGAARYRLLDTVRQYAWDRLLETGQSEPVRDRHLAYFLSLAETAGPKLQGPEQAEWFQRLEDEHENLRAAFNLSLHGIDGETHHYVSGQAGRRGEGETGDKYAE